MSSFLLTPEDYTEPACPFCKPAQPGDVTPVPLGRITEKLDEYLGRRDFDAAMRHLAYWKREAEAVRDLRGLLAIANESMGLYRKLEMQPEAEAAMEEALSLVRELGMEDSVTAATTCINAATVCRAFGNAAKALPLYQKASLIYEAELPPTDERLGGLYNNMALAEAALKHFPAARSLYQQALSVMGAAPGGEAESAITLLNLADLAEAEKGPEEAEAEIGAYLEKALACLSSQKLLHDTHFAYTAEKCAPVFRYYGYFADADALAREAERIYNEAAEIHRREDLA